jgi:pimeloyl-ACP methyl ester carboxylesterase
LKVVEVLNPGATAVQANDVVTAINGKQLTGPKGVGAGGATYGVKPGESVKVSLLRGGAKQDVTVPAIAAPLPALDGRNVEMGVAQAKNGPRVRTYLLEPTDKKLARGGRLPAVMILPGINCGTVEAFGNANHPYTKLFKRLTEAGFVVVMADKPGQGDSEGTPCLDGGYTVEEQAFRAAAKGFVADKRIDPKRFYIIGISLGGVQAPLVAESSGAAGVITWGALVTSWYDYLLTTFNRRTVLEGGDPVQAAEFTKQWRRVLSAIFVDGKSAAEVKAQMPEAVAAVTEDEGDDLTTFAGRAWAFHREVDQAEVVRAWNEFDGRLLALHGEFDWVSELHDHRLSVDIVNRNHPGNAALEIIPGNDHGHTKHASLAASFAKPFQGEPDDAFFTRCVTWLTGLAEKQQ